MDGVTEEAAQIGLDLDLIDLHQHRIKEISHQPTFPIVDTCRLDNGGILPLEKLYVRDQGDIADEFTAFVPAAGAASRFFRPLHKITDYLYSRDYNKLRAELLRLKNVGALDWPLLRNVRDLISLNIYAPDSFLDTERSNPAGLIPFPKALHPCVLEDTSFFAVKIAEHRAIGALAGQVYVIPARFTGLFTDRVSKHNAEGEVLTMEQGPELSTLRFTANGEPLREKDGALSPVPAGHGVLTSLFARVEKRTGAHSAFIRNIDNVMGTQKEALEVCRKVMRFHHFVLIHIDKIRLDLENKRLDAANTVAREITERVLRRVSPHTDMREGDLWYLLAELFHTDVPITERNPDRLIALYDRPVNTLGQVRNTGKDTGGVPVFIDWQGQKVKICLEMPHMTEGDIKNMISDHHRATHFNPVFVACELNADYVQKDNPFWLLAKKFYRDQNAVYHETLLYETLGNSINCNVIFVEVPRIIFNPHKSMADAAGKRLSDWGIEPDSLVSW